MKVLAGLMARPYTGPGPWRCPTCSAVAYALALVHESWVCNADFQAMRARGEDPEIRDARLSAVVR